MQPERMERVSPLMPLALGAGYVVIAAGLMRVGTASLYMARAQTLGQLGLVAGMAEVFWGIAFWRRSSRPLHRSGVFLTGVLITLSIAVRLFPLTLSSAPDGAAPFELVTALSETIGLAALVAMGLPADVTGQRPLVRRRALFVSAAVAFAAGWAAYGAASVAGRAFAPVLAGAAPAVAPATTTAQAVARKDADDQVDIVVAGIATPLADSNPIPIGKNVLAEIKLKAVGDGGRFWRTMDVYLYPEGAPTSGITDATVKATARMRYMDHGMIQQTAVPVGDGHYLMELPFIMPGEWDVHVSVGDQSADGDIQVSLNILDYGFK